MVDLWRNFLGYRICHVPWCRNLFHMSQPNYNFGLKCYFVREEINKALNKLHADIERLFQFHRQGPFKHSFKAFDVVNWPNFPSSEIERLVKDGHRLGLELLPLWERAQYFQNELKGELEAELFWIRHKASLESDDSDLESLAVSFFENPEQVHESDYRLLIETMDAKHGDNPLGVRSFVRNFSDSAKPEQKQEVKEFFEKFHLDWVATPGNRDYEEVEPRKIDREATQRIFPDAPVWNVGFTLNQACIDSYLAALRQLALYLNTKASTRGEIDVAKPNELVATLEDAIEFYVLTSGSDPSDYREEIDKLKKRLGGNTKNGFLKNFVILGRFKPVQTFERDGEHRAQNAFCAFALFEKMLASDFLEENERRAFLADMNRRSLTRINLNTKE
ncbi:hypothetical protein N9L06_07500 [Mariniblastus sp.]|nr:hypothetical protein [Mariniblastus sp.]